VEDAHQIASDLERQVRDDHPAIANIVTHIESRRTSVQASQNLTKRNERMVSGIHQIVNGIAGHPDCHSVEIRLLNGRRVSADHEPLVVSLHCYFDPDRPIGEVHRQCSAIEERVMEVFPEVERVSVHAEPRKCDTVTGRRGDRVMG
jgi:divalent metal cation (Fe/Co/Zn/Cd) transporter